MNQPSALPPTTLNIKTPQTSTSTPKPSASLPPSITIRFPPFTYLHLTLLTTTTLTGGSSLDLLTARAHLTSALQQFLGMTGTAIPIDFLKVEDTDVWIRVPREDGAAVVGAVSGWSHPQDGIGWRVRGRGDWLGAVVAGGGRRVFEG